MISMRPLIWLNLIAFVFAGAVVVRMATKSSDILGADFHSYWYAGHFVWQGTDPYAASDARAEPDLPIVYWDGTVVSAAGEVPRPGMSVIPGITAPLLLVVSLLSRLSWTVALTVWLGISVAWLCVAVWGVTDWLGEPVLSWRSSLVLLLGLALLGTREAFELGQSTLAVFGTMMLAFLMSKRHPVWAGILLGFALSKPSLTFPAVVVFLLARQYVVVAVAAAVQLIGALIIGILTDASIGSILGAYWSIAQSHSGKEGMHLARGLLASTYALPWLTLLAGTVAGFLVWHYRRYRPQYPILGGQLYLLALAMLMLMNLLLLYHRRYDNAVSLLFLGIIVIGVPQWRAAGYLSQRRETAVYFLAAVIAGVWILPLYAIMEKTTYIALFNLSTLSALVTVIWLMVVLGNAFQRQLTVSS